MLLTFLLAVAWVWKSTVAVKMSRELTQLRRTRDSLVAKNNQLNGQLEKFRSIAWIDSCAGVVFGMNTDMKNRQFIYEDSETKKNDVAKMTNYAELTAFWEGIVKAIRGY